MTTTKPVVDSLSTQGKGMPENDVPPQTIIRAEPHDGSETIIRPCKFSVGGIVPESVRTGLTSLPLPGEHIIPIKVGGGAEGIIRADPLSVDGEFIIRADPLSVDGEFIIRPDRFGFVEAESRRQSVQAESMVNIAIGVVAAKMTTHRIGFACDENGRPTTFRISITPQELSEFCWNYTVKQQIGEDGGFIITVTPKE